MKMCKMYISTIVTLCLLITSLSYAQRSRTETEETDTFEAQRAGIADAKNDVSFPMWYGIGCIPIFGIGAAYLIVPKPSHERLMGRPMEYVWAYSESYRSTRRSLQTRYALFGCLTFGAIAVTSAAIMNAQADEGCSSFDWSCGTSSCNDNWNQCNENWSSCNENWEGCGNSDGGCSGFEGCGGSDSSCGSSDGCGGSDSDTAGGCSSS
ncbi:MAG: hypothetical protein JSW02_07485 [candidate division WOR-3 bacterium]|nr:MAG: hypothetical protein JSW02_07485 [candidate division WOR-3 bacterium]